MRHFRIISVPRERDDQVLRWLAMRHRGMSIAAVAKAEGVGAANVERATNCVVADDIKLSGEPEATVRRDYW